MIEESGRLINYMFEEIVAQLLDHFMSDRFHEKRRKECKQPLAKNNDHQD